MGLHPSFSTSSSTAFLFCSGSDCALYSPLPRLLAVCESGQHLSVWELSKSPWMLLVAAVLFKVETSPWLHPGKTFNAGVLVVFF